MKQLNLEKYNDYELIYLAREQNEIAYKILHEKYYPIIINVSKKFYTDYPNIGLDLQDYILEANYTFDKSIYYYNDYYENSFYTYFINSLKFSLITIIKRNLKNKALNNSTELDDNFCIVRRENNSNIYVEELIKNVIKKLKPIEKKILILRLKGYKYFDISEKLNINKKKVDNTLSKIRKIINSSKEE